MARNGYRVYRRPYKSILIILSNSVSDFRLTLAARHLELAGYDTRIISAVPFYLAAHYDVFIAGRPGEDMCKFLETCVKSGKRVIIDLDDDFNCIPKSNPSYMTVGPGSPTYLKALNSIIAMAEVTYASAELANRYKKAGVLVPNCYDEDNQAWYIPKDKSERVRIGFTGTTTHREDFKLVAPALHQILKDRPDTSLTIGGDNEVYNQFSEIPEDRKTFYPYMSYERYPLGFRDMDMLLVPLQDKIFTRAKSDIKMVEAGAAKIPWIASDLPVYSEWGAGGIIATDWYADILNLVSDSNLRENLGNMGAFKAAERTSKKVGEVWVKLLEVE